MHYVTEYSQRDLAYAEDRLRAFQGILNAFKRAAIPIYNFWGIPLSPLSDESDQDLLRGRLTRSQSQRFAFMLFWVAPDATRRQGNFPSWSWAAWSGRIDHPLHVPGQADECADVVVQLEDEQKITHRLVEIHRLPHLLALDDHYTMNIRVEGWTIDVDVVDIDIMDLNFRYRGPVRFCNVAAEQGRGRYY
ncbi:hypothetical protein GGR56DRAFT_683839 [Xylariaceae sp. FL0804]|nr:hypothetical protein GGR56DRAFT_683839 [Xylariaceae sp. FL0804]